MIPLTKESGCINVIVRDGTNKLIDSDLRVSFSDFTDRTVSVIAGNSAVYDSRADAFRAAFLARFREGRFAAVAYESQVEGVLDRLADHLARQHRLLRQRGGAGLEGFAVGDQPEERGDLSAGDERRWQIGAG